METIFELNGKTFENSMIERVSLAIKLDKLRKQFDDEDKEFNYINKLINENV